MKIQKPYRFLFLFPASPPTEEEDLFSRLPSEILNNILSRLPLRSIAFSKCVCKPWLHLLETDEFVPSYLSKSAPALAVIVPEKDSNRCKILQFEDELDLDLGLESHDPIAELDLSSGEPIPVIKDAANGLLLLRLSHDLLRLCNPITRQYIDLRCSIEFVVHMQGPDISYVSYGYNSNYGIGASKVTGQYKVLRIDHDYPRCHVYTLGTRQWRRIQTDASFKPSFVSFCAFLNGYLHWVTSNSHESASMICCFDVEAECFSSFLAPSLQVGRGGEVSLSVLKGCLCICGGSSDRRIEIWLMKEYGVEESWSKEFVVELNPLRSDVVYCYYSVEPIRVFKNGDILMVENQDILLYYSDKSKTTREIGSLGSQKSFSARSSLLTPSFVSLRSLSLRKEKVDTMRKNLESINVGRREYVLLVELAMILFTIIKTMFCSLYSVPFLALAGLICCIVQHLVLYLWTG